MPFSPRFLHRSAADCSSEKRGPSRNDASTSYHDDARGRGALQGGREARRRRGAESSITGGNCFASQLLSRERVVRAASDSSAAAEAQSGHLRIERGEEERARTGPFFALYEEEKKKKK